MPLKPHAWGFWSAENRSNETHTKKHGNNYYWGAGAGEGFSSSTLLDVWAGAPSGPIVAMTLWGEVLISQCPRIFSIEGHCKWAFQNFLPMRSRNPLKRELPPQMKTFCTISRTCIWFSLIKLNELGLCRTSMKTFCTICRICSEKGLGFGVKKKIFTISRICSEKKPRRGFRV